MKLPTCVLEIVRSGTWMIVVASANELFEVLTSPEVETETLLLTDAGAVLDTLTVAVIAG